MITNAAKHDVDEQSLVQEIQQLGLPKENSENIGRAYREHKEELRVKFAEESYTISRLLSTDWRVDQVVAASHDTQRVDYMGPLAHLRFEIDCRPQDGIIHDAEALARAQVEGRVHEFACEVTGDKLDVLISELARAHTLLQSLQN